MPWNIMLSNKNLRGGCFFQRRLGIGLLVGVIAFASLVLGSALPVLLHLTFAY